jgi:ferrochelatase
MDGGAWLEPDLPATFAAIARGGARAAVIASIGFVSDHVETLYDLDVEAPLLAAQAGLDRIERAPTMNTRPRFIDALEGVVRRML